MNKITSKYSDEYIYDKYINNVQPRLDEVRTWIFEGRTARQIAGELGITNSVLWAIRTNKNITDVREIFSMRDYQAEQFENVENALYRRCVGYSRKEEQAIKVKKEYYNKKGKKCSEERVEIVEIERHIDPDIQAIKFYLLNNGHGKYQPDNKVSDDTQNTLLENAKKVLVTIKDSVSQLESDEDND